jgi:hypothetical protein
VKHLLWLVVAAACGSATGPAQPDAAAHASLTSLAVTPSTVSAKRGLDAPTQLVATATLSDGRTVDVTNDATWMSSNATAVGVSPAGLVTPLGAGMATVTATYGGMDGTAMVTAKAPKLYATDISPTAISTFDAYASGDTPPLTRITGAATTLTFPWDIEVVDDEIYVSDPSSNSVDVWPIAATGNVAPTRRINGALTKLSSDYAMTVFNHEIFVASTTTPPTTSTILVFPTTATGNVAPTREIVGAATLMSGDLGSMTVYNNELFVADINNSQVLVFPVNASGNVAPSRVITNITAYDVEVKHDELYVAHLQGISVFPLMANGTAEATIIRKISGTDAGLGSTLGVRVIGTEVYTMEYTGPGGMHVFPRTAVGDPTPTRNLPSGGMTLLAGPRDFTLY